MLVRVWMRRTGRRVTFFSVSLSPFSCVKMKEKRKIDTRFMDFFFSLVGQQFYCCFTDDDGSE